MGKYIVLTIVFIGIGVLFVWLGCETGLNVSLDAVGKSTAEIFHIETPLKSIDYGIIHLEWTWTVKTPEGDGIIVERSITNNKSFEIIDTISTIDSVGMYIDTDSTRIKPLTTYYYRLSLLKGGDTKEFLNFEVHTPSNVVFELPPDTVSLSDTLVVKWKGVIDSEGKLLTEYKIELQEGSIDNPGEVVVSEEFSGTPDADTFYTWKYPVGTLKTNSFYIITITASKIAEHFTDTSTGKKVFFIIGGR